MGSLYRSKHEMHLRLPGRQGAALQRGRAWPAWPQPDQVWDYASVNSMAGSRREDLALHPTVKPTALVADALQDVTRRGELVLELSGLGHDADRGGTDRAAVPRPRHRSGLCRCRDRPLVGDDRKEPRLAGERDA